MSAYQIELIIMVEHVTSSFTVYFTALDTNDAVRQVRYTFSDVEFMIKGIKRLKDVG